MEMNYRLCPVIDIDELERCVSIDTKRKFKTDFRQLLFDDNYMNDVYVSHYFMEDAEYHGYSWQDPVKIEELNLVNKFLRENFAPEYDSILVDVSW